MEFSYQLQFQFVSGWILNVWWLLDRVSLLTSSLSLSATLSPLLSCSSHFGGRPGLCCFRPYQKYPDTMSFSQGMTRLWWIWIVPSWGRYTLLTVRSGASLETTQKGPCQGCDNFRLRPLSSLGNLTSTNSSVLYDLSVVLRSYRCFDFRCDSWRTFKASSHAEDKFQITFLRQSSSSTGSIGVRWGKSGFGGSSTINSK